MTARQRAAALEAIAAEISVCTRCRLHEGRTQTVPGEGHPSTEVIFVGEGPGFHEDEQGRPFVGAAGQFLETLLASIGWRREEVFITNLVKCRPPGNRDPEPDEIAACAPFLRRQLEALDPALVVTLGRHSLEAFRPGARIGQAHGTVAPAAPSSGVPDALHLALYHPAAGLRSTAIAETLRAEVATIPATLERARARRASPSPAVAVGPGLPSAGEQEALPEGDGLAEALVPDAAAPTETGAAEAEQLGLFR